MNKLKEHIRAKFESMTPTRVRKLMNEVGIMVLLGWDLSASFIFNSMIKFRKDVKLDVQGVKEIFIGSRFVEDEKSILMWALYPPYKRP